MPDSVRVSIKGLLCTAAVLVAASVTLTGCALFSSEPVSATCANGVSLYFADDKSMRTAAQRLREDDRVGDVRTETQEQMLRRLVRSFPELADGMRDQTSSEAPAVAAVHVAAVDAPKGELASVLGDEFADALAVEPVTCVKGDERTAAILSLSQSVNCRNSVLLYFGTDAAMTAAASALRNDHRATSVVETTREEAFRRAKEQFADQPELVASLQPDDMSPFVEVTAANSVDARQLAAELQAKLPDVEDARVGMCIALPHPVAGP